ncbi:hypothetical protein PAHAL_8G119000 [Panicum hallii]|uniref:Uncharacterized protein n=1 Tax=Panicum hallii TaxID=206008 RepID=A0A2T8I8N7_9POAL|nr:hypothetical protein PAHAL_8G119000 [Panicum hallii]
MRSNSAINNITNLCFKNRLFTHIGFYLKLWRIVDDILDLHESSLSIHGQV